MLKLAPYLDYRRILTGTPIGKGAMDIYTQMEFLNPGFWKVNGFASYVVEPNGI